MTDQSPTYPGAPAIPQRDIQEIAKELGIDAAELEQRIRTAETNAIPAPAAASAAAAPAAAAPAAAADLSTLPPVPPAAPTEQAAAGPVAASATQATPAGESTLPPVTHTKPILTYGAAGQDVEDLVKLLAVNGYTNTSFSKGENPSRVLDNSVMSEVKRFASEHHVSEDLQAFYGLTVPAEKLVGEHVGPYIWQALIDGAKVALKAAI
jgi:hypothetical protein